MRVILGGHHSPAPEGWRIYNEAEIDIRMPLPWPDGGLEAIFTEHVIEHISFVDAVGFFKESARVLRPGGLFRCVTPTVDVLVNGRSAMRDPDAQSYLRTSIFPSYPAEEAALNGIGLSIADAPTAFL